MPVSMTFAPVVAPLSTGAYREVIGAGGLVTGIMGSSDGTVVGRLDTNVAHVLGPTATEWQRLLIPGETIAIADIDLNYDANTYAAAVAWTDPNVVMLGTMGYILVRKPGATLFTRTALPQRATIGGVHANDNARLCGNTIDICPTDTSISLVGLPEGVFRLTNHGDNFSAISTASLPLPSTFTQDFQTRYFRYIIRWDRSLAGRVYVFVPGSGLYRSTDYGVSWTKITDAPVLATAASHMKVHPTSGLVLLAGTNQGGFDGQVRRWNGSAWSVGTRTDGGGAANLFAVEFSAINAGRVYGVEGGGAYRVSLDSGLTWDDLAIPAHNDATVDIRWHGKQFNYYTASELVEHPTTGNVRMGSGIGAFEFRNPQSNTAGGVPIPIHGISRGIENMVATCAIIAPNGNRCITMQDKQSMFFSENAIGQVFPKVYGPVPDIGYGTDADYAPEDPNFWVVPFIQLIGGTQRGLAWTPDMGKTWTICEQLPNLTGGKGWGRVAVLSKDVWIAGQGLTGGFPITSTNRAANALYITRDRGVTWTEVVIGNGNAVMAAYGQFTPAKSLCKDPYTPGTVYFYNAGDLENPSTTDQLACRGIWKLVDTGSTVTVTRQRSTRLWDLNKDGFNLKLVHGGAANRLLVGAGTGALGAFRSTDGGVNWTELTGTDNLSIGTRFGEVYGISAGAPHPSAPTVPTLWVDALRLSGADVAYNKIDHSRRGLWESRDNGATWTRRQQFTGGYMKTLNDMSASMNKYGDLTLTTDGQGATQLLFAT